MTIVMIASYKYRTCMSIDDAAEILFLTDGQGDSRSRICYFFRCKLLDANINIRFDNNHGGDNRAWIGADAEVTAAY